MAKIERFEDLNIWKAARCFNQDIFKITSYELFSKDYRFRDQIRASAGSVMDNIAEGFERGGNKEFIQFLYIAKGSSGETRSQLYRAFDCQYISQNEFNDLCQKVIEISQSISAFISYLKIQKSKGSSISLSLVITLNFKP